jgi:hypothetical protein
MVKIEVVTGIGGLIEHCYVPDTMRAQWHEWYMVYRLLL